MKVITLSRKPCAASSTTANIVEHHAGALHIDACRIGKGEGGTREGEESQSRRYTERGSTSFAPTPGIRGGDARGRWPANAILQHQFGCQPTGTTTTPGYMINRWSDGAKPFGGGAGHEYESEGQPDEEIIVWECAVGCAMGALEKQADTAARYFKQVQKTNDMTEIPNELREYLMTMISPPADCDPVLIVTDDLGEVDWGSYENLSVHGMITVGNPEEHMKEIDRVLRPGAHLLVIAPEDEPTGHTGACTVEDFGYEIRDAIAILDRPDDFHYIAKASPSERNAGIPELKEKQNVERLFLKEDADPVFVTECRDLGIDLSPEEPWTESDLREMFATSDGDGSLEHGWLQNFECREVEITTTHLNNHPTIKSIGIMERLLHDVPADQGPVVDPFMGSGTTGLACLRTGHDFIGIEQDAGYVKIADHRVRHWDRAVAAWNGAEITSEVQIEEDDEPVSLGDFFGS